MKPRPVVTHNRVDAYPHAPYVEAELPGLKKEDFEITYDKGVVDIQGTKKEETEDDKRKFYRRSARRFHYRVSLPTAVDESKDPRAEYKEGVLILRFAKAQKGSTRKIALS